MNPLMVELFMSVVGVLGACQVVPQCVRIYRRKKSDDFSFWTIGISILSQSVWLWYSIWKFVPCMIVATVVWLILLLILLGLIIKYREKIKR